MKKLLLAAFLALFVMQSKAIENSIWSTVAQQDLAHIYQTVKQNHPGYLDKENPYFKDWLEQGYVKGQQAATTADSLEDVMSILKTYVAGFADGHFSIWFDYQPVYKKWAGLIIAKQGGDYRVIFSDENWSQPLPPKLSTLVSCDGRVVEKIMAEDILKSRFSNLTLNYPKVRYASRLLVDDGIGERQHFKSCQFKVNNIKQSVVMKWQNISATALALKTQKQFASSRQYSIEEFSNDKYWVSLPKFYPNEQEQKKLEKVINSIKKVNDTASLVVLDVRGNGGGNSQWGVEVAKALYGEHFIESFQKAFPDTSYALWRASQGNHHYMETQILPLVEKQFGKESDTFELFSGVANHMKQAISNKIDFVRQNEEIVTKKTKILFNMKNPIAANVVLLTDSSCGSACLDFADLMLKLPNVVHMGQETGADTVYMDIRTLDLPSGLGQYSLAQKVYRDRLRKHNESYVPEYQYKGDISNTPPVNSWLQAIIKSSSKKIINQEQR